MDLHSERTRKYHHFGCWMWVILVCMVLLPSMDLAAKTCVFNTMVRASNDPFGSCPIGTDTILVNDTMEMDVNYEPFIGGLPFEGKLIVDNGVLFWSSNVRLSLGANACIVLRNGGHLYPENEAQPGCTALKTLYFDLFKVAACNGQNAQYAFFEVNAAKCVGSCCDSTLQVLDNFRSPAFLHPDLVLIKPNPSEGDLTLQTQESFAMQNIELLDAGGRPCAVFQNLNLNEFEVIRPNLAPGVYFVRVIFREGLVMKKVILY